MKTEAKTTTRTAKRGKDAVRPPGGLGLAEGWTRCLGDAYHPSASRAFSSQYALKPGRATRLPACSPLGRSFLEALYGNRGPVGSRPGFLLTGSAISHGVGFDSGRTLSRKLSRFPSRWRFDTSRTVMRTREK